MNSLFCPLSRPAALSAGLLCAIVITAISLPVAQAQESASTGNRNLHVAPPTKRVALVIGNAAYPGIGALRNPANDARDFATKLKRLGFDVIVRTDLKHKDMLRTLTEFGDKVQTGSEALFFYAGHGMQVRGRNYLIPVDAEIRNESSVSSEAVDVDQLLDKLTPARLSMVILDACRNNPFERRFRGGGQGLAQINAPTGTLIAYATAPGRVAADGDGRNGLYTAELLAAMDVPGIRIEDVFKRVRANVFRKSNEAQTPWESSSLTGDFYFRATGSGTQVPEVAPTPADATEQTSASALTVELAFWQAAKEHNDPAQLRAYLARYPNGEFAPLARLRLEGEFSRQTALENAQPLIDTLPPEAFKASSIWSNDETGHGPANSRFSITDTHSNWSTNTNDQNQWLQVDLQRAYVVGAIGTKGRHKCEFLFITCPPQWVTTYRITYSLDGTSWQFISEGGNPYLFSGNSDNRTEKRHELKTPVKARYLKFHPQSWNDHITMRVEAYGHAMGPQ